MFAFSMLFLCEVLGLIFALKLSTEQGLQARHALLDASKMLDVLTKGRNLVGDIFNYRLRNSLYITIIPKRKKL